jgi:hypothetical protein
MRLLASCQAPGRGATAAAIASAGRYRLMVGDPSGMQC